MRIDSFAMSVYWQWAHLRHDTFNRRVADIKPYALEPLIARHRWCNVWRVLDRVSQRVVRIGLESDTPEDAAVRVFLLKIFNRTDVYDWLCSTGGEPSTEHFPTDQYCMAVKSDPARPDRMWSGAYVMRVPDQQSCPPGMKAVRWLRLMGALHARQWWVDVAQAPSLSAIVETLSTIPGVGRWTAYQYATDFGYVGLHTWDEDSYVTHGPGSRRGVRRIFAPEHHSEMERCIEWTCANQDNLQLMHGFEPLRLKGRKLKLIDVQNVFCEFDKYARVAHPGLGGVGMKQIKRRYPMATAKPLPEPLLPAHWHAV